VTFNIPPENKEVNIIIIF